MSRHTQSLIPGIDDDTKYRQAKRSRRLMKKAIEARDAEPIPSRACANCESWMRMAGTTMGECLKLRVQTVWILGVEKGTITARPDDDRAIYGETFEPLRTHQAFRACSAYERMAEEAA